MAYRATKPTRQVTGYQVSENGTMVPITSSAAETNKIVQDATRATSLLNQGVVTTQNNTQNVQNTLQDVQNSGSGLQSPYQTSTARGWNPETMGYNPSTGTQSVTGTMNKIGASGLTASQEEQVARFSSGEGYGYTPTASEVASMRASLAEQNRAAQETQNLQQQEAERKAQQSAASSAAGAAATRQGMGGAAQGRFQGISDAAPSRQDFIEQQRAAGKSDAEIRQMINTLPPEQTGGAPTTQSTTGTAANPTGMATGATTGNTTGTTGTPNSTTGQTTPTSVSSNPIRAMADLEADPLLKILLNTKADAIDAYGTVEDPQSYSEFLTGEDAKAIAKPYDSVDEILSRYQNTIEESSDSRKSFLEDQFQRNQSYNAQQQRNIEEQLMFQQNKATRDQADANKKMLDSQTIMLALQGGFGSADGNKEIAEARLKGEEAIIDLQTQYGFKRTDVSLEFTRLHNEAYDNYQIAWLDATDKFETAISDIALQGISNQQAKSNALSSAYKGYVADVKATRVELAKKIEDAADYVYQEHKSMRNEELDREDAALEKIKFLLDNYNAKDVSEAIKELGKDVKSFDVQALIDNPTFEAIEKAKKAKKTGGGGWYASAFLPSSLQEPPKPEVTFEEFVESKFEEMAQSFSPSVRAEIMAENEEKWREQYDAAYLAGGKTKAAAQASSELVSQFGQPVVDAARAVMDGTFGGTNPVKNAAKEFGVPSSQVATALVRLRQTGDVSDTSVLSPEQQKAWNGLRKSLEQDPYYTTYNGAKLAIGRINAALSQQNGVSDIAAINGFQNGIVDPNATVRAEDVALIQSAMSWADRVDLNYWKQKIDAGAKLPQAMREQMAETAKAITAAYERAYIEETLTRYQQEVQQAALPQSVLEKYGSASSRTTVDPSVSSFVDSLNF